MSENSFKQIDVGEAKKLLADPLIKIIDIRAPEDYEEGHIGSAQWIGGETLATFIEKTDKATPILCYCYRGFSSQLVSDALINAGFKTVYSLQGGYEAWR